MDVECQPRIAQLLQLGCVERWVVRRIFDGLGDRLDAPRQADAAIDLQPAIRVGSDEYRRASERVPVVIAGRRVGGSARIHLVDLVADRPAVIKEHALAELLKRRLLGGMVAGEVATEDLQLLVGEQQQRVRALGHVVTEAIGVSPRRAVLTPLRCDSERCAGGVVGIEGRIAHLAERGVEHVVEVKPELHRVSHLFPSV